MTSARIYLRVSTDGQDLERQEQIVKDAEAKGITFTVYREKASGARSDRPELNRMINDLQKGEIVIAEKIDRISRLPLPEAEALIAKIESKGAKLSIPGIADLSSVIEQTDNELVAAVLKATQKMLLTIALQQAREDYETRRDRQAQGIAIAKKEGRYIGKQADKDLHEKIIELRTEGKSIADTAKKCGCGTTVVKTVWKKHNESKGVNKK